MLVLHIANALQDTTPDGVAQVLSGSLRVNIAQVDCAVEGLRRRHSTETVGREGHIWRQRRREARPISLERGERGRLCYERLSGSSLRGLRCGLLRLGDVGTAVLAVVDALARPSRLRRQRVDDLRVA